MVHGDLLRWFTSLEVVFGIYRLEFSLITSGIPQGSYLGLLLLNLYVSISSCKFLMYADDIKIFYSVVNSSDHALLQKDLNRLVIFCENNSLILYIEKCHSITFTKNKHTQYCVNNESLPTIKEFKT